LCRNDLYFLLRHGLGRADIEKEWLFERCVEVQKDPNGMLDLWSREHYKSTIITIGKTIQDILASHGDDPIHQREFTFGIFSHTRPIAKAFLRLIKREFEGNPRLREWFPDILYENPQRESPKWSEDDGIIVKRNSNPNEATVEAHGVVDGQPISKHFVGLIYDDVVTRDSVNTTDMINKTTEYLELSYALGAEGGFKRFIGTRYHFNDTYKVLMDRKTVKPRIYPATHNGELDGTPVLMGRESLAERRRDMGEYTFSCQMLQNPVADSSQGFKREWIKYYDKLSLKNLNIYFVMDAANAKSRKYKPHRKGVRYERYGLMGDIDHIKSIMEYENYRFDIIEVGGMASKEDRIRRLIPYFEQGRIYFPRRLHYTGHDGKTNDLIKSFIEEEFRAFPVADSSQGFKREWIKYYDKLSLKNLNIYFVMDAANAKSHTFNSHWEEVQEVAPLNPVYDVYYDLEDQNMLYSLVAMDGNELLGYVIFIIAKHHHHSGSIWASSDILYISPTHSLKSRRESSRKGRRNHSSLFKGT